MTRDANRDARSRGDWQGMNWIRQSSRLALYLRDGLACVWCGHSIEDGASLSLDHVTPHSQGGSNAPMNLVTACERCNKSRGTRSVRVFAAAVAEYLDHGAEAREITQHVRAAVRRSMVEARREARVLIARRGSVARVLARRGR